MQQYQAWAAQEMPKYMADVKSLLGGLFNPPRVAARKKPKRKPTKAERAAQQRRLNPRDYLLRNDAYHFFDPLGALIKTGPTQTNVSDLRIVLVDRR
jgi:hypothetical protein